MREVIIALVKNEAALRAVSLFLFILKIEMVVTSGTKTIFGAEGLQEARGGG